MHRELYPVYLQWLRVLQLLKNIYGSIKAEGKLIFTTLNGLCQLFHSAPKIIEQNKAEGKSSEVTFDLMTFRDHSVNEVLDDSGSKKKLNCNIRYYMPSEITWLLKSIGFKNPEIYGCQLGAFSRNNRLSYNNFEMLIITEK